MLVASSVPRGFFGSKRAALCYNIPPQSLGDEGRASSHPPTAPGDTSPTLGGLCHPRPPEGGQEGAAGTASLEGTAGLCVPGLPHLLAQLPPGDLQGFEPSPSTQLGASCMLLVNGRACPVQAEVKIHPSIPILPPEAVTDGEWQQHSLGVRER